MPFARPLVPVDHADFEKLERRIAALEKLVACPRCRGNGSVETPLGKDECPECHGTKINRLLTDC